MPRAPPPNPTEKHTVEFQFQFDWQAAIDSIPYLAKGIPYTLMISFGGLAIGFVLGIVFGLLSINKKWFLRWPATAYIEIFRDRKSTRLNSSHVRISYAVFCLKKKKKIKINLQNS